MKCWFYGNQYLSLKLNLVFICCSFLPHRSCLSFQIYNAYTMSHYDLKLLLQFAHVNGLRAISVIFCRLLFNTVCWSSIGVWFCALNLFVFTCIFQFPPSKREICEQSFWPINTFPNIFIWITQYNSMHKYCLRPRQAGPFRMEWGWVLHVLMRVFKIISEASNDIIWS